MKIWYAILFFALIALSFTIGHGMSKQAASGEREACQWSQRGRVMLYPSEDSFLRAGNWVEGGVIYYGNIDFDQLPYGPLNLNYLDEAWWNTGGD